MKILLISPPYPHLAGELKYCSPPLGLAYIAAVLEQNQYTVKIVDCVVEGYDIEDEYSNEIKSYGLNKRQILSIIDEYKPNVIGISCLFTTHYPIVEDIAKIIKGNFSNIKIVLGGTHPTITAEELVRKPFVDYVVRGEGEYAFLKLIQYLEQKRRINDVNNLTWFKDGKVHSSPQEFIQDIDKLPFPARHLLNMEGYIKIGRMQGRIKKDARATTLITSRGCPAKCIYCSIHLAWGHRFRAHSPEYVLNELQELQNKYDISYLLFEDDNLTFNRKRAEAIFQGMINRGFNFTWTTPNGVAIWALDERLLKLMRASGCYWLYLGVESGVQETLTKIIRKPLRLDKVKHIIKICNELGLHKSAFFVIGLPGETMETMKLSMKYAEDIDVDSIIISIATAYPGTPLYKLCKDKGYFVDHFQDYKLWTKIGQIRTSEFRPEDVEALARKTFIRRDLKHPVATFRRLIARFYASPVTTISAGFKRIISIICPPRRL